MSDNFISRLRRKPKHVRDNIAFGVASGVTGLVLIAWLVMVPGDLFHQTERVTDTAPEAFKTFRDQFNEHLAGVRGSVPEEVTTATTSLDSLYATTTVAASSSFRGQEVTIMPVDSASSTLGATTSNSAF